MPRVNPPLGKATRFQCAACPKEFSRRENLIRHARIRQSPLMARSVGAIVLKSFVGSR